MAPATTTVTKKPNFLPLLIGGAAVLYFVTRKNKMTAKQRAARAKFKAVVAEAKKLRKKY
jgi:hypothetical protein